MILTEVWVPGHPRTKGSLDPADMQDTPASKHWRALVAEAIRQDIALRRAEALEVGALEAAHACPTMRPVLVRLMCWVPRRGEPRTAPPVMPEPAIWSGAGDLDKLARNALDALAADSKNAAMNGGAFVNDNQVTRLVGEKYTARGDMPQGMLLVVESVTPAAHAAYANLAAAEVGRVRDERRRLMQRRRINDLAR